MRDWIRNRLDAYGQKGERYDEFAATISRHVDALNDRKVHRRYLALIAALNIGVWLAVLVFPRDIEKAWLTVTDLSDRIGATLIAIVFGLGLWLTYTILRWFYPDIEQDKGGNAVFGSYERSLHATKRWRVWLVSVIGGILNALLLVFVEIYRAHGW